MTFFHYTFKLLIECISHLFREYINWFCVDLEKRAFGLRLEEVKIRWTKLHVFILKSFVKNYIFYSRFRIINERSYS